MEIGWSSVVEVDVGTGGDLRLDRLECRHQLQVEMGVRYSCKVERRRHSGLGSGSAVERLKALREKSGGGARTGQQAPYQMPCSLNQNIASLQNVSSDYDKPADADPNVSFSVNNVAIDIGDLNARTLDLKRFNSLLMFMSLIWNVRGIGCPTSRIRLKNICMIHNIVVLALIKSFISSS
ncbi:hypothetical protein M5K25_011098 [Dendrobium thyrsiflorum]|uniref:Uncharacterized protein n=1 Tax=Dendrobium thyrsiflorum TaxID=117978 RepID=A0ABD0V8S7_DENTH